MKKQRIPKIIHYIWFGQTKLPRLTQKCLESWEKYLPDYKIMRWDESNFDLNTNNFVREAYDNKKWAFVSDYVRLHALKEYGGIYMDTDVEVVKNLDEFLHLHAFSGFENNKDVTTAVIGSEKNGKWINEIIKYYERRHFVKKDNSLDCTANPIIITNITNKMFNLDCKNSYQDLGEITFFPKDYFCPLSIEGLKHTFTKNTHTIHHFSGSWLSKFDRREINIKKKNLTKYREIIIIPSIILSYTVLLLNKLKIRRLDENEIKENRNNIWSSKIFGKKEK
ncbi:MAG: glycosyltransferase [Bacilli bacterium]